MKAASIEQVAALSADFTPYVSDQSVTLLAGKIVGVEASHGIDDGIEKQMGLLRLLIEQTLTSSGPSVGDVIQIPFKQVLDPIIRVRNAFDQWNTLNLTEGSRLLAACRKRGASNLWEALAARNVTSSQSIQVQALQDAEVIERLRKNPDKQRFQLAAALTSPQDILFSYAIDALGRRSLFGREQGTALIANILESPSLTPQRRLQLGQALTEIYFFDPSHGADHSNQLVISALANMFTSESESARRLALADDLARCVLDEFSDREEEDQKIRRELIHSVPLAASRVLAALSTLQHQTDDSDERRKIGELEKAWRASAL